MAKRRRLPNGFGQITKIKNKNLRNPFRAMVTVGKTETGRPIVKLLEPQAYFRTYNDAYAALLKYHESPYDLDKNITVEELYDRWSEEYFKTLSAKSSVRTIKCAWSFCEELYDMPVADVRVRHIKGCIEKGSKNINGKEHLASPAVKTRIKSLFNMLLDYAVEYEIVDRNYARSFNITKVVKENINNDTDTHIPFTDEEIAKLWNSLGKIPYVDAVLIQCYTGLRPQELGLLKVENINFEEGTIIGGMKTDAGFNRVIPIHSKIYHLVELKYKEAKSLNSEYLLNILSGYDTSSGTHMTYGKYRYHFIKIIKELNMNPEHKCHDPRIHFITMAKKYKVDEYAIKYIVGHSINDITEKVYTKRNIEWLKEEIENIK